MATTSSSPRRRRRQAGRLDTITALYRRRQIDHAAYAVALRFRCAWEMVHDPPIGRARPEAPGQGAGRAAGGAPALQRVEALQLVDRVRRTAGVIDFAILEAVVVHGRSIAEASRLAMPELQPRPSAEDVGRRLRTALGLLSELERSVASGSFPAAAPGARRP